MTTSPTASEPEGNRLVSLDNSQTIKLIVVPADSIRALRGLGRGERLVEKLLEERQSESEHDDAVT
jgi:hypothetical protein